MNMAIAVETMKHPQNQDDYRVWYLELNQLGKVIGIGVKNKSDLVANLFSNYQKNGQSCWRAFKKGSEKSTAIEALDFISKNKFENTHFGNLPTLNEFQMTLNHLQMNLEMRITA